MTVEAKFNIEKIEYSIRIKYGWGASKDWTNFHFKTLNSDISEQIGKQISVETLKRIFGKRKVDSENYQPQVYNQIALLKFVEMIEPGEAQVAQSRDPREGIIPRKKSLMIVSISFLTLTGLVIMIFAIVAGRNMISFSSEDAIGAYPFTVHFNYDIANIKDSVFTDFGWEDETFLPKNESMISYYYPIAGEFNVLLYTREKILDSVLVISCADEWIGGYFPSGHPWQFKPFSDQSIFRQESEFYAPLEKLSETEFDLVGRDWTAYKLLYPQNVQLDKITLETRVLNSESTRSLLCYDTGIRLIGKTGTVDFHFTHENCSRYAKFRLSEKFLDGQFDDLDALSVDLSDWLDIRIEIEDNMFKLFLSDSLIFKESYFEPMGMLVGVGYKFLGSGKIDHLKLKNQEGDSLYSYDFSSDL